MADNRTTVKTNIVALNVPSVTNTKLNTMLNTYLADNLVFGADVIATQSSSISNITCNFTGYDRINLTRTGGALNITVAGMSDGEEKSLLITKTAGQAITFVGVTDITPVAAYVTAASTVLYKIIRKGNYYAIAWLNSVQQATESIKGIAEIASTAEAQAGTNDTNIITPAKLQDVTATTYRAGVVELATSTETQAGSDSARAVTPSTLSNNESWATATLSAGYSGTIKYRKNNIGNVEIHGNFTPNAESGTIFTLPVGYRPSETQYITVYGKQDANGWVAYRITVTTAGVVGTSIGTPYINGSNNYIQGTVFLTN